MSAEIVSLLAVTFAFLGLLIWVYAPKRKQRLESMGDIPLRDESSK